MAMGRRTSEQQEPLWLPTANLLDSPGHPFYQRLNDLLREHEFDWHAEDRCQGCYAQTMGRPGLAPGG